MGEVRQGKEESDLPITDPFQVMSVSLCLQLSLLCLVLELNPRLGDILWGTVGQTLGCLRGFAWQKKKEATELQGRCQ